MRKTMAVILTAVLTTAPSATAWASEPMTPVEVTGSAAFQQDGSNWHVTTASDRTVINWTSFNVDLGAQVHFEQPGSASSVLNRVLGSQMSRINGLLSSNGSVYLANPNGVVIGPSGVVRVADFVATTLSIADAEFLAGGDMNFKGTSQASIQNFGKIEALGGDIYLIARNVVNQGSLTASAGSANLVAGADVLLTQDHKIFVRPSGLTDGAGIGVDNSGVIDAVAASLQADGNMYALAINNSGVIRATGSQICEGQVVLLGTGGSLASSGSVTAQTVTDDGRILGGRVKVLADHVTISGSIDASGEGGGLVETSGSTLDLEGMVLACGQGGTWQIDPPLIINAPLAATISAQLSADTSVQYLGQDGITVAADIIATPSLETTYLLLDSNSGIAINANINIGVGRLFLWADTGVAQALGTSVAAGQLWLKGSGVFDLNQPGNDFGTIGIGVASTVWLQDANDLVIGNVGSAHGVTALGGEVHITTPNGHIFADGLFNPGVVTGYHALGNVAITETSWNSESYQIRILNEPPFSKTPAEVAAFVGLTVAELAALTSDANDMGSAVCIEFGDRAGTGLGYSWNFKTGETFSGLSANDYSFVVVDPIGPGAPEAEVLADVATAASRGSAVQHSNEYSWETRWGDATKALNGRDPYTVCFGTMNVDHPEVLSGLFLGNMYVSGNPLPLTIYERIWDHVEDFPHLRPDERVSNVGNQILAPMLDELSTYFDQSAQRTDPRYFYQSVGSIYQIPR